MQSVKTLIFIINYWVEHLNWANMQQHLQILPYANSKGKNQLSIHHRSRLGTLFFFFLTEMYYYFSYFSTKTDVVGTH